MVTQDFSLSKTLNPPFSLLHCSSLSRFSNPLRKTLTFRPRNVPKPFQIISHSKTHLPIPTFPLQNLAARSRDVRSFAGRSKKKAGGGGSSGGRIEGNAEFRREVKRNARRRNKKMAESLFYRLKNPNRNHPDNFTEDELQEIGLGYDRLVRFMEKDDPNLRHPHDWYKYGQFGPYSWRGVVLGDPVRGRFSDERVAMISEVRDAEEWERIEQFEMGQKFGKRLEQMDRTKLKYFWIFVRHPRWRLSELAWQQWTLVCEVVVEAGDQRLDKWSLMGRLGNMTRSMITKCAAWMRPDIIYVKRPVYQCRFEPQDNFFRVLMPYLDPKTEMDCLFELEKDDGSVELCTYYGGLCKILKVSQKAAYVDDVVKAYEKLSDEKKSKCLEFLLKNHPMQLLHPYTKEWKAKLEEMELGCDAPDDESDMRVPDDLGQNEIVDWIEEEDEIGGDDEDDNVVMDMEDGEEEGEEDDIGGEEEEDDKYWEEEFKKALESSEGMEKLVRRSVELSNERYKEHLGAMDMEGAVEDGDVDGDEDVMRGKRAKVSPEEWKIVGIGPWRKRIKKSRIPPELFLRAAVRPFTYRNLVKEIVLTRHAILDGDISANDKIL
ncbi:uncharacterized protein LOC133802503 [Humulus lupulus]|uniref:uncharacterized protein LOC133802503 n=1 Tax=Humulus lupulus TaxID=3486 RepID=UPI002B408E37|nr:uncharacterized protein LOC133802503 [Humulus lupulus]